MRAHRFAVLPLALIVLGCADSPTGQGTDLPAAGMLLRIVPLPADGTADRPRPTASADTVTPSGQRTYRVKAGDSFYSIARDVLGDPKRWQELLELNRDAVGGDPTHLQIGQALVLPEQ